jgi:DNA-binding GntR family transcriptional regulator
LHHVIEVATRRYVTDPALGGSDKTPASTAATRTHEQLVELIADTDASGAEALWRKHIPVTSAQLRRSGVADLVLDLPM